MRNNASRNTGGFLSAFGSGLATRSSNPRKTASRLKLRQQQIADLLLLAEELLVERVQADELLIGELSVWSLERET